MHVDRKTVGELGAAVELTPEAIRAFMDQQREIAAMVQACARLLGKADRLERAARRLPLGNGKRKKLARAALLRAAAAHPGGPAWKTLALLESP